MSQEIDLDRLEAFAEATKAKALAYAAIGAPCAVPVHPDELLALLRAAREKDQWREKALVAISDMGKAVKRAEEAEARATAATDALSSLIDWTRRYIEAHPSAQGASYGTILHDSEATLRALLAAEKEGA